MGERHPQVGLWKPFQHATEAGGRVDNVDRVDDHGNKCALGKVDGEAHGFDEVVKDRLEPGRGAGGGVK
jgi:hypothetical protein